MLGNYMGDFIKASEVENLPAEIKKGVLLHRFIDEYTDNHQEVLKSKELVRPYFKKYSPVVIDIFYDHFLALNWEKFHHEKLDVYAQKVYVLLENNKLILPTKSLRFLQYLTQNNMLVNYKTIQGMEKVFQRMSYRASFNSGMEKAHVTLQKHFDELEMHFNSFFPDLDKACKLHIANS
jgi:acyl carrier protein phosphodiesterase